MHDTTTPAAWRTYTGAEFRDVREIPCAAIANGQLIDAAGDPVYEDHPELAAEIERRGRDVYRDHGYGDGHEAPGWGSIPVVGCDHTRNGEIAAHVTGWFRAYGPITITAADVAEVLAGGSVGIGTDQVIRDAANGPFSHDGCGCDQMWRCPGCGTYKHQIDDEEHGRVWICLNPKCEYDK